jgi:pyrroloquinoline quinone (PQQ) biosynthesis protein C
MSGASTRDDYLAFLGQLYFIVREFCPTMAVASARLPSRDPYYALKYALYHRIDDEKAHQDLVLRDIASLGGDAASVAAGVPGPATDAMIGYNYYSAERENPCSVFAMLYVLETLSSEVGPGVARILAGGLGLTPATGLGFFASHAEMDREHAAELVGLLDALPSAEDRAAVVRAARVNYFLFARVMI